MSQTMLSYSSINKINIFEQDKLRISGYANKLSRFSAEPVSFNMNTNIAIIGMNIRFHYWKLKSTERKI